MIEMKQRREPIKGEGRTKFDKSCQKLVDYGILGLIVFSPLPAASVHDWSILVLQISVLIMMAAYFMMREKKLSFYILMVLSFVLTFFYGINFSKTHQFFQGLLALISFFVFIFEMLKVFMVYGSD